MTDQEVLERLKQTIHNPDKQKLNKNIKSLQEILAVDPDKPRPVVRHRLARLLEIRDEKGDIELQTQLFIAMLKNNKSDQRILLLTDKGAFVQQGAYVAATQLTKLYLKLGNIHKAFEYYQVLMKSQLLTPQNKEQYYIIFVGFANTKLSSVPNDPAFWYDFLGRIHLFKGAHVLAKKQFKLAKDACPENVDYSKRLGYVEAAIDKMNEAGDLFRQALLPSEELPQLEISALEQVDEQNADQMQAKQNPPVLPAQFVATVDVSELSEGNDKKDDDKEDKGKEKDEDQEKPKKTVTRALEPSSSVEEPKNPQSKDLSKDQTPSTTASFCRAVGLFATFGVAAVALGAALVTSEDEYNGGCTGSGCDTYGL